MMIRTANQQYAVQMAGGNYRAFVERECITRWGTRPNWEVRGEPLKAWVNRSNWAVNCDCCRESVVAEPGEPYFCPNCLNATNGGYARPVAWPRERAEIERILLLRPNPDTRNYLPDDSVATLREDNLAHGHGV